MDDEMKALSEGKAAIFKKLTKIGPATKAHTSDKKYDEVHWRNLCLTGK